MYLSVAIMHMEVHVPQVDELGPFRWTDVLHCMCTYIYRYNLDKFHNRTDYAFPAECSIRVVEYYKSISPPVQDDPYCITFSVIMLV